MSKVSNLQVAVQKTENTTISYPQQLGSERDSNGNQGKTKSQ